MRAWRHAALAAAIVAGSIASFVVVRHLTAASAHRQAEHRAELAAVQVESSATRAAAYVDAMRRLAGRPMVIRTLDLGADKYTQAKAANPERNFSM